MASGATNIKIQPINVTWEIEEKWAITALADVASSLDAKYFILQDDAGSVAFWIDVDDSGTLIPAGASAADRAIEILTVTAGMTASAVAGVIATAIAADSKFGATAEAEVITVRSADAITLAAFADGDSGFIFAQCQQGGSLDLGLLDGDVEFSPSEELFDVTSHQTGTTIKASLRQGNSVEVTTVLQETINSKLNEFYGGATGGEFTPGAGTKLFGQGSSRQGTNALIQARRLILKPVNAIDDTENLTIFRAYPVPDSLTFSGENPKLLSVSWRSFDAESVDSNISMFAFGDQNQVGVDD